MLEFVDDGGHALIALNEDASSTMRELAADCGVDVDEEGSVVVDHLHHDASSPEHTLVYTRGFLDVRARRNLDAASVPASPRPPCPPPPQNKLVLGDLAKSDAAPVLFRGVGMAVSDESELALRVLAAEATAYSADPRAAIKDYAQSAGTDTLLVAAVQANNNARVVVAGSLDLFSNDLFASGVAGADEEHKWASSSNRAFAAELSAWNFGERGMLRARDIVHRRADGSLPATQLQRVAKEELPTSLYPDPEIAPDNLVYRIKDEVEYAVTIEEWRDGAWQPHTADDVQLEFVMLNPYVRTALPNRGGGRFATTFKVPDAYGIYKFRLHYRRPGYSVVIQDTQVSVRPFKHNEYERFIGSAYPYYAAAFAMLAGFFVFGFVFLYHDDKQKAE